MTKRLCLYYNRPEKSNMTYDECLAATHTESPVALRVVNGKRYRQMTFTVFRRRHFSNGQIDELHITDTQDLVRLRLRFAGQTCIAFQLATADRIL